MNFISTYTYIDWKEDFFITIYKCIIISELSAEIQIVKNTIQKIFLVFIVR